MRSHKNLNQPHLLAVTKREVLCLFHCSIFLTLLLLTCSVGCGLLIHIWSSWKKRPDSLLSSAPGTCSQYTSCAGPGFHLILLWAYQTSQNSRKDSVGLHLSQPKGKVRETTQPRSGIGCSCPLPPSSSVLGHCCIIDSVVRWCFC